MITRNHNIYLIDMNARLYDPMLGRFLSDITLDSQCKHLKVELIL